MKQFYIYQEKNDDEIWQNIKKGNENAFSIVFQHYYNHLYNYGLSLTHDEELVKDVIQEVFINVWNYRKKLGKVISIKIYLLTSLRRALIKKITKNKKNNTYPALLKTEYSNPEPSAEDNYIDEQSASIRANALKQNLAKLSARQREVIHLKFYHGLENSEITEIMAMNHQSVRNLVHEAIKRLKVNIKAGSRSIEK